MNRSVVVVKKRKLHCPCGSDKLVSQGYRWVDTTQQDYTGYLVFLYHCEKCGKELYD